MILYPHNQQAYESLVRLLADKGRACIVHPTGTGKSFIGYKYVIDHPKERILWLGPSEYIFSEQAEAFASEGIALPGNLARMTYQKLLADVKAGVELPEELDCVVFDEFHRCGAEKWSEGVAALLDANPGCKIIGLSATPTRFSDEGRNMATEMFGGNIASEITLTEAWILGILPKPVYITSVYSAPDELNGMLARIERIKDAGEKSNLRKQYNILRRRLMDAGGIPSIIGKHLKKSDARLIVFCPNAASLKELHAKAGEWFAQVSKEVHAYRVFSANPYGEREMNLFKKDGSNALKVLYCINQLNEGVHVKGIDGIVMARPTGSPIVFHQQLGRCLDSSMAKLGKNPLVFDFCNNLGSLGEYIGSIESAYANILDRGIEPPFEPSDFEIFDEIRELREISDMIDRALEPWTIDQCLDYLESL